MRDFNFQTVAILTNRIVQPLRKKSSLVIMPEFLFSESPLEWQKEMSKLGYLNQEKKIKIFTEVNMNDFFDSSKMGDRKDS